MNTSTKGGGVDTSVKKTATEEMVLRMAASKCFVESSNIIHYKGKKQWHVWGWFFEVWYEGADPSVIAALKTVGRCGRLRLLRLLRDRQAEELVQSLESNP